MEPFSTALGAQAMTQESDIIERLTAEIRDGKSQSKEAIRELRAEIERLRGENAELKAALTISEARAVRESKS